MLAAACATLPPCARLPPARRRRALPLQEKFRHFSDLWRLDLATWAWEQLPIRGGPSARSGHRVALHKNRMLVFGGFYDTGRETRCTR